MAARRRNPKKKHQRCLHVIKANRYARSVVAGTTPACEWVVKACQRHLDDLKKSKDPSYPYKFSRIAAERVCRFIELLPHTKGPWALRGEKIKLEPWQCFLTCSIFGWLRRDNLKRRFRRVFLLIPRKNGKSLLAAAWGLYMLAADNEHGAEVYSGATTQKQAMEVFRPARIITERTGPFRHKYGVHVNALKLSILKNNSIFEPIIGKPGDGASPSCSIHDEYHEHDTDDQVDAMQTGMGARDQPLQVIITTAGDNLAGPCYQLQLEAQQVLSQVIEDEELFACIYTLDKDDDWKSMETLRKANPNFGVSVSGEFLEARLKNAIRSARKQGVFRTKHLNEWVGARDAYFNVESWIRGSHPDVTLSDFAGQPCMLGLDLASKVDIAALEVLFRLDRCTCDRAVELRERGLEYFRFGKYYLPESAIKGEDKEHYRGWAEEGWITVTGGQITDYDAIKDDIQKLVSTHQVENVGYDPHQATMFVTELMKLGVPVVEYRPTVLNFSEPMKTLDALILSGRVGHVGDLVMTWMVSNTTGKEDAKENVYPRREKKENKIDGVIAHLMALGLWMSILAGEGEQPVVSDELLEACFG